MSLQAEFWRLQVKRDMLMPTLQFQIQVSNEFESNRFNVLCNQARVVCKPDNLHSFNLGQTDISIENKMLEPRKSIILSSNMDLSPRSLEVIEKYRGNNDLRLQIKLDIIYLNLTSNLTGTENFEVMQKGNSPILIPRSEWRDLLDQLGYQETFVLEVPSPAVKDIPQLTEALDFLRKAKLKYIEGEDMGAVVTNCRQAIDKTIGAIDEDIIDLKELFDEASIAKRYPCLEDFKYWSFKIRKEVQTIKNFCGPGPHVEVPVTRSEARYALIHTANVLSYLAQVLRTRERSQ